MTVNAQIAVRWRGMSAPRHADRICIINQDLKINPVALQDFSGKLLTSIEQDLVILAGSVAFADRVVRRQRSKGWMRHIELSVPVSNPDFWRQPEVLTPLLNCLEYVTGDRWVFRFVKSPRIQLVSQQSSLDFTLGNYVVIPFSDGLDSFLQWQLQKKEQRDTNILKVFTSSRSANAKRNRDIDSEGDNSDQRLKMPIALSVGEHAEPTYRSRTFLFYVLAGLAAYKFDARYVLVGENGVGTLGPSLVPFGGECPHRTTHPAFTRRLSNFLNSVLGAKVTFKHPQLFRTKGQVLRKAIDLGISGWEKTRSCTRVRVDLGGLPCGVCGGCLLRRTAVYAAGCTDGQYFWDDLSKSKLDECRSIDSGRVTRPSDCDIAKHGVHDMSELGALSRSEMLGDILDRAAWELVGVPGMELQSVNQSIKELVERHAAEWSAFRSKFGPSSFLNV